jgi:hypothetical protein
VTGALDLATAMPAQYLSLTSPAAGGGYGGGYGVQPSAAFTGDFFYARYLQGYNETLTADWYVIGPPDITTLRAPTLPSDVAIASLGGSAPSEVYLVDAADLTGWDATRPTIARSLADVMHGKLGRARAIY